MRIGIDFDNTIICYDGIFHAAAVARDLIPAETGHDKTAVRDYLRRADQEDLWTELQGIVYGKDISRARPYPGVREFITQRLGAGDAVFIVSHKTRYPYIGERHDLHAAARGWLVENGILGDADDQLDETSAFFELTKEDKLARIGALDCDLFIDDLPEFLGEAAFPAGTRRILFDPVRQYGAANGLEPVHSWHDALKRMDDAWQRPRAS